jgi:hypothetical protein
MQGNFPLVCLPFLLVGLAGCGHGQPSGGDHDGELGQGLVISPGVTVSSATYTISGPNGFASAGSVVIGDSPDVSVVVSQLPVGQGYELVVSGTASDGVTVCDGTATFDVTSPGATLTLVVHLECAVPTGNVSLSADVNICPVIDDFSASPLNLKVGGVATLSVTAHDVDSAPSPLAYSWTVNGVTLPNKIAPSLSFTCTSLGVVTLGARVSDGDTACIGTATVNVSCE